MRTTLAAILATGTLLFGGVGLANATVESAPASTSTTTLAADDGTDNDNTGLWGLAGLLGLLGLAGLVRRDRRAGTGNAQMARGTDPRV
jgi:hypothetical protein